ncbi:hypothetical protein [Sinosporangium siamense]|uniref:Uncharacterized protein n=1 Tax=Sinosporangium siamense TaxID=1367973 RepID=A0A919RJT7_9ACTN|nr:hypothetical protein [Sinosporangium siamense]GII93219.1 hypothetical protein Ssi02_34500 [Sinosporangium siamense]
MSARLYTGILALSLAALAGCGGQGERNTAAPAGAPASEGAPAAGQDRQQLVQSHLVGCMKEKGFKYIAYARPLVKSEEERKMKSGDYETMKKHRSKYGYGAFAHEVYPDELSAESTSANPNDKIVASLSTTQRTAHRNAQEACSVEAAKSVLGMKVSNYDDVLESQATAIKSARDRSLDGDTALVQSAQKFGECMKGRGYEVASLKPTEIATRGENHFFGERAEALGHTLEAMKAGGPRKLAPEQARAALTREIKDALDDLECGKDFYAAYLPKNLDVTNQVRQANDLDTGFTW